MKAILIEYCQSRFNGCLQVRCVLRMLPDHAHFSMAKVFSHGDYTARHRRESDRDTVAAVVRECLDLWTGI